jgi:hypothetical protein
MIQKDLVLSSRRMAKTYLYITQQFRERALNRLPRVIVSVSTLSKAPRVLLPGMSASLRAELHFTVKSLPYVGGFFIPSTRIRQYYFSFTIETLKF